MSVVNVFFAFVSQSGLSALHIAASGGNPELIEALLEGGAEINQIAHKGETPLMFAVMARQVAAAEKLLEKGAEASSKNLKCFQCS